MSYPDYAGDIQLIFDNGVGEMSISSNDLSRDKGMQTAISISLFTDKRATDQDDLPDGSNDLRGWWADNNLGSKLWLLFRSKTVDEVVANAAFYAQEALQWMIDDGVAENVICLASREGRQTLKLSVQVIPPIGVGDAKTFTYFYNWKDQLGN